MSIGTKYRLEKITDLSFYTEGPAMDKHGNIYCTTLTGGSILKVDSRNNISEWGVSMCPNGQFILPDGDHLVCDVEMSAVRRFSPKGKFLINEIQGFCCDVAIFTPNDLVVDSKGNLYFTDSQRYSGKVCFLSVNGEQRILSDQLDYPNGIVLSPDEQWLLVAESYKNRIIKIKLKSPGEQDGGYEVFAELPVHTSGKASDNLPDGLAWNSNGELLVAHYGMQAVQVISEQGRVLSSIDSGIPLTSNLCLDNEQTLVVTGGCGEPGPGSLVRIFL